MMKIEGSGYESGSISQSHGSADPDPDPDMHQNVMDPQHCFKLILEHYTFCDFRIIFKAYCTAQSVSPSTYCGMLDAFVWTERARA